MGGKKGGGGAKCWERVSERLVISDGAKSSSGCRDKWRDSSFLAMNLKFFFFFLECVD